MIVGPMTMVQLAGSLANHAGRHVLDKTGLEGRYFCAVAFSRFNTQQNDTGALDIFAAVQQ